MRKIRITLELEDHKADALDVLAEMLTTTPKQLATRLLVEEIDKAATGLLMKRLTQDSVLINKRTAEEVEAAKWAMYDSMAKERKHRASRKKTAKA